MAERGVGTLDLRAGWLKNGNRATTRSRFTVFGLFRRLRIALRRQSEALSSLTLIRAKSEYHVETQSVRF